MDWKQVIIVLASLAIGGFLGRMWSIILDRRHLPELTRDAMISIMRGTPIWFGRSTLKDILESWLADGVPDRRASAQHMIEDLVDAIRGALK